MKKIAALILTLAMLLTLTGCVASEVRELEKTIFTYGCRVSDIRDLKDHPDMHTWASGIAKDIEKGKYTQMQVKALISNLDGGEFYNVEVEKAAKMFLGYYEYPQRLESDGVIPVLEELEENAYDDDVNRNFYHIYWRCIDFYQVRSAAEKQLTLCSTESGYYDDFANRHEIETSVKYNVETKYEYEYMGDFCMETKYKFSLNTGEQTAKEPGVIYYRGNLVNMSWASLREAEVIYSDGTDKLLVFSEVGLVDFSFTNFTIFS